MKRILGEVTKKVVEQWGLKEHQNKKIVMYYDRKEHCKERHLKDYENESNYYFVMDSLEEIIQSPDYVFYNKNTLGLEYYKKLNENILIAVRISNGKELKVRSVYPVYQNKIERKKKRKKK
mgnify:CR=1 FL=1